MPTIAWDILFFYVRHQMEENIWRWEVENLVGLKDHHPTYQHNSCTQITWQQDKNARTDY